MAEVVGRSKRMIAYLSPSFDQLPHDLVLVLSIPSQVPVTPPWVSLLTKSSVVITSSSLLQLIVTLAIAAMTDKNRINFFIIVWI